MNLDADPYRTLGLTRGASLDEVKRAYRRLAKANHPDAAGATALPRFLAIHAAYEQIVGGTATPGTVGSTSTRRRPSSADAERADATRRAYGGRPREPRPEAAQTEGQRTQARGSTGGAPGARQGGARTGRAAPGSGGRPGTAGRAGDATGHRGAGAGAEAGAASSADRDAGASATGGATRANPARGKATLGSTSYDGADAGPFEPDWGGASWYGTTSGTYWTINPKEYADPRKHGPEYQARARRAAATPGATTTPGAATTSGSAREDPTQAGSPTHSTSSWWESTSGPDAEDEAEHASRGAQAGPFDAARGEAAGNVDPGAPFARATDVDEPAPDPTRAAMDLARALTDPRSGGLRGRAVRAVLGWLPIAFGLGWLIGELTGCGRFAATCDPSVGPLTFAGQAIVLLGMFLVPEIAAIAAGAALVLLAAAVAASLILSATGTAADEASRRTALGALLVVAWLSGLGIAIVRRVRSGTRSARPVS